MSRCFSQKIKIQSILVFFIIIILDVYCKLALISDLIEELLIIIYLSLCSQAVKKATQNIVLE